MYTIVFISMFGGLYALTVKRLVHEMGLNDIIVKDQQVSLLPFAEFLSICPVLWIIFVDLVAHIYGRSIIKVTVYTRVVSGG